MSFLDEFLGRPEWQGQAACRGVDPGIFFTERGQSTAPAKLVCQSCPVREECLDFALENGEKFGIFGGKSERERRVMRRVRNIAAGTVKPTRCGTVAGSSMHKRRGEPLCEDCRIALRAYEADRRWKRANGLAS